MSLCGWCGAEGADVRGVVDPEGYDADACAACRALHRLTSVPPSALGEPGRAALLARLGALGEARRGMDVALAELGIDLCGEPVAVDIDRCTPEAIARLAEALADAGGRMVAAMRPKPGRRAR